MTPSNIYSHWASNRHPVAVERAIRGFLAMSVIAAAKTALLIDARCGGGNPGERFVDEVEAYLLDPAAWRRWKREQHRKRVRDHEQWYGDRLDILITQRGEKERAAA